MTEQAQARPEETAQGLLEGLRSGRARVIVEDAEGCHSRVYGAATVAEAAGRLVPAVTPEAVKATKLWELLAFADHDVKTIPTYAERLDEYDTLHLRRRVSWEDEKGSYYWWELTEQGRTIHAALQQSGLAADGLEHLRADVLKLLDGSCPPGFYCSGERDCEKCDEGQALLCWMEWLPQCGDGQGWCERGNAALATGEPGEPTADELLDALERGELRATAMETCAECQTLHLSMPWPHSRTRFETGGPREIARAIIAAQRGGKE